MIESKDLRGRFIIIFIVTALLAWAYQASGIRLGQDLRGGTTLRFSLDVEGARKAGRIAENQDAEEVVRATIEVIQDRVDRSGLGETQIVPLGEDKFQISLPAGEGQQGLVDSVISVVSQLGDLKFRIEVLPDEDYIERNDDERPPRLGVWPGGDRASFNEFKGKEIAVWRKARAEGQPYQPSEERFYLVKAKGTDGTENGHFHLLEEPTDPQERRIGGEIITSPRVDQDTRTYQPVVLYDVKTEFESMFGDWTERSIKLPMAIVLNDEYWSAPTINSKLTGGVQISLGSGSAADLEREAKELVTVLQTGSLKIQPTLEAKNEVGASLAGDSRDRGIYAIIVAFIGVLVFMLLFYRSSGLIANVSLLLNVGLLLGFLAFFQAVLTLPGIAGIVLTIGMAVDANILINERIRDELRAGRSLRRAVSEGYDKALSAIIDGNVTGLITAIFLYNFGTGPIRGFAITLALGLLVSMFTAIYVSRTLFEWAMQRGWIKNLTMWGKGEPTNFDWLGMRKIFVPISVVAVLFGLFEFFNTPDETLYDVDFNGGIRVQARFHTETSVDDVKKALLTERDVVVPHREFGADGTPRVTNKTVRVGPFPGAEVLEVMGSSQGTSAADIKVQRLFDSARVGVTDEDQAAAFEGYIREALADRLYPDWLVSPPTLYTPPDDLAAEDPLQKVKGGMALEIALVDPLGAATAERVQTAIEKHLPHYVEEDGKLVAKAPTELSRTRQVVVREGVSPAAGAKTFQIWVRTATSTDQTVPITPAEMRRQMGEFFGGSTFRQSLATQANPSVGPDAEAQVTPSSAFPSTDLINPSVARRLKDSAFRALVLSLLGIIVYVAIRFRSWPMGFAAVACLFHDVALTLGVVAVINQLGWVDAKLNLPMVAAFLTLVGYSVNDTVVIFDRIRENRGKSPILRPSTINLSLNQTLARTIKTSATFLLVCVVLFGFNVGQRNILEGFSFLLIVGAIVGTYSTVAISAPLLLFLPWLWRRLQPFAPRWSIVAKCAANPLTLVLAPIAFVAYVVWAVIFGLGSFIAGLLLFTPWALGPDAERASHDDALTAPAAAI